MARSPHVPGYAPVGTRRTGGTASATSGTQRLGISGLRNVLRRYISPILLDSVLNRAIAQHASDELLPGELLKVVTADCMIGLRLFVPPDRLPDLMLELAELLEGVE
jgi:hypothetical protein